MAVEVWSNSISKNRINLESSNQVPAPERVAIRKQGLFGGANRADQAHQDDLIDLFQKAVRGAYAERCAAGVARVGRDAVVKAILAMETEDDDLPAGSLAQEAGRALTQICGQELAQAHVAINRNYVQQAIALLNRQ